MVACFGLILLKFTFLLLPSCNGYLSNLYDVTSEIFADGKSDVLAAFGDFNADKLIDLFVICHKGKQVDLLSAQSGSNLYARTTLISIAQNDTQVITSVMPGDYDGDVQMDILLTKNITDKQAGPQLMQLYWGLDGKSINSTPYVFHENVKDEPLILDWNADMLPDVLVESVHGEKIVFVAGPRLNRTFNKVLLSNVTAPSVNLGTFRVPHSNAFLDLNDDLAADLFITEENGFAVWYNMDGTLEYNLTTPLPRNKSAYTGQSTFADIDQDGIPDHLVPVCEDSDCLKSAIYVYSNGQWHILVDKFEADGYSWRFVPPDAMQQDATPGLVFPVTLRMGDFDIDGYPDAIAVMQANNSDSKPFRKALLLLNTECTSDECSTFGRTFKIQTDSPLNDRDGVLLATFVDLFEDGLMDILLVVLGEDEKKNEVTELVAFKNGITADACFLKITVVSGLCTSDCPKNRQPYGVNVPGPAIKYKTVKTDGSPQRSCGAQLSQSAHFALQLPYTVFGLGQTPNFVDSVTVGIPKPKDQARHHDWTQIIPNSQLIVIPHPNNSPNWWLLRLFMTPSHLIMMTGAALIGTCGFVAGIVGILHWREKREDKKEKRQDAQKFHFDAM